MGACRTSDSFQTGWVFSHLKEVEKSLGKPLLLEEFGKKVHCCVPYCVRCQLVPRSCCPHPVHRLEISRS